jgi:hypothetical protein
MFIRRSAETVMCLINVGCRRPHWGCYVMYGMCTVLPHLIPKDSAFRNTSGPKSFGQGTVDLYFYS